MAKSSRDYIYGVNPVFETVRAGKRRVYEAFINQATAKQPRLRKLAVYLKKMDVPIQWADKRRVNDLSGSRDHQGVVLKAGTYPYMSSDDAWDKPRLLLLDNVEDPHNVGAILRSAEIFGFHTVLLSRRGVPDIYPSVVKVSAGATEFLDIAKDRSANAYVRIAQEKEYQVVALDGAGKVDVRDAAKNLGERTLVVIGGENKSVGQFIINAADMVVSIRQTGRINSLNASVAAGISFFALAGTDNDRPNRCNNVSSVASSEKP